jgi:NAD(P)-dependent dehydrogenase (short-subunit alcohol dehydrogenase family)
LQCCRPNFHVSTPSASVDRADTLVRELEGKGVRGAAFKADQGDAVQVTKLVKGVVAQFGRLDILVNNAALFVMVNDPATDFVFTVIRPRGDTALRC